MSTITVIVTMVAVVLVGAVVGVGLYALTHRRPTDTRTDGEQPMPQGLAAIRRVEEHEIIRVKSAAIGVDDGGHVVLVIYTDDRPPLALCLGIPESAHALAVGISAMAESLRVPDDARELTEEAGEGGA